MLRNYFLTAWRNLGKNKLNAFINVLGLAVAFTCCILLFLMVHHEFSFDQFQQNNSSLYKVYHLSHAPEGDVKSPTMAYPAAPAFKAGSSGIIRSTPYMWAGAGISYNNKEINKSIALVSNDFFSMFSFPVTAGNAAAPLASPGDVVINTSTATALFGKENAIGKVVKVKTDGKWKDLVVTAVLADAPQNSSVQYQVLARIEIKEDYAAMKDNWNNQHHQVYVQLAPNASVAMVEKDLRQVTQKYRTENEEDLKNMGYRKDANGDMHGFKLAAFNTLHFDEELGTGSTVNKTYLYTLVLIAVVVMVIACFNFINLNVARSLTRAKEVGVRKTIGAGKREIFLQLWTESFLLCMMAALIAIGAALLLLQPFNVLFTEKLNIGSLFQSVTIATILTGILVVSFMAGGYPAWLVSRFNAVEVLKGKVTMNNSSVLRNGLILFQFVMASVLICSTLVIYSQFQHLRTAPLGFEQESVISIPVKNGENSQRYLAELRQQLAAQPQVASITGSSVNFGIGKDESQSSSSIGFSYNGKVVMTGMVEVDYDYLKTTGIQLLEGREFSPEFPSDTAAGENHVIITQSMARQLGKDVKAGFSFYSDSSKPKWTIIGIVPDFHLYSMHEKIKPLTLGMGKGGAYEYLLVKVKTNNPLQTLNMVQDTYKKIEPDNTVSASYLTENTLRWYRKEQRLSTIFCTAAGMAIILSCLGLFAIVSLVMEQRRKEVGIRKVLGASISGITGLLCKDFLRLVLIAFIIAVPVAWHFLNKWLENFEYRIQMQWWVFPLAGLLTLVIAVSTIGFQTLKTALANPVKSLRSE